jgi:hypothetical protein
MQQKQHHCNSYAYLYYVQNSYVTFLRNNKPAFHHTKLHNANLSRLVSFQETNENQAAFSASYMNGVTGWEREMYTGMRHGDCSLVSASMLLYAEYLNIFLFLVGVEIIFRHRVEKDTRTNIGFHPMCCKGFILRANVAV